MIDQKQFPPEVVEAAAKAITMALILAVDEDCRALALTDDERAELARAAIAAALAAWPGMEYWPEFSDAGLGEHEPGKVFLPLTEARDE